MMSPLALRIALVLGPALFGIEAARAAHTPGKPATRPEWILIEPGLGILPRIPPPRSLFSEEKITLIASSAEGYLSRKKRTQEWRLLPQPQPWEYLADKKQPPRVDSTGFEIGSKVGNLATDRTVASFAIAPDRVAVSGEIINARTPFTQIGLGDPVFVRAEESLQVGTTYSITNGPQKVSSERDGRVGFIYAITGKIKIIGVRDGVFVGTITELREPIYRGNLLIPEVEDLRFPGSVASPSPLKASVLVPQEMKDILIGQHSIVFLDVGSAEGVAPGMIFRSYLKEDPETRERLPTRDFMIESELQVLSVQEQFSVAIVLQSRSGVRNGSEIVSLTDLKDFERNQGLEGILQDLPKSRMLNDLDSFDRTDGLGEKEGKDLEQLEKWKKPEASPGTGTGLSPEDIKKESLSPELVTPPEIGSETAPEANPATAPEEPPTDNPTEKPTEEALPPSPPSLPSPSPSPSAPAEEESDEDSGF
jgi:hypothetical protein